MNICVCTDMYMHVYAYVRTFYLHSLLSYVLSAVTVGETILRRRAIALLDRHTPLDKGFRNEPGRYFGPPKGQAEESNNQNEEVVKIENDVYVYMFVCV
jgi:hypothetical protein